ncbi:dienelactone hydrolase family protein [Chitinasiproducens palmae]|uniref:Carboxymethylenebutenolidase n=1 Tax=Chitinasiproducens palmae TaxID=1770053 RepID=A0A1H2PL35_9BURK|nr:dienelactone hydrolase family protein [Chitinasiproducens palmae]SDV47154.1 carboxymethylenebutenolidase [Chitinasiproducens palmae]
MGSFIRIPVADGQSYEAWLETPPAERFAGPRPAVVILPEIYNVNEWARGVARRYAEQGYLALVPDLFWRLEPGRYLPYTPEAQQEGRALYARLDVEASVRDIDSALTWLRGRSDANGKAGVIGFCLGGQLAFLSGVEGTPDAIVSYYGTDLQKFLDRVPRLRVPALLHFGERDTRVPPSIASEIEQHKTGGQDLITVVHPDAPHGFSRNGYVPFNAIADAAAQTQTLALLTRTLGDASANTSTPSRN